MKPLNHSHPIPGDTLCAIRSEDKVEFRMCDSTFLLHMAEIDVHIIPQKDNKSYLLDKYRIQTFNNNSNGQMQLSIIHFHALWNT